MREPAIAAGGGPGTAARPDSPADVRLAYAPYVIIILVFAIVQLPFVKPFADSLKLAFRWPFLDVVGTNGKPHSTTMYSLTWMSTAGTLLLISGLIVALVLKVGVGRAVAAAASTPFSSTATVPETKHSCPTRLARQYATRGSHTVPVYTLLVVIGAIVTEDARCRHPP